MWTVLFEIKIAIIVAVLLMRGHIKRLKSIGKCQIVALPLPCCLVL